MELAPRCPHCNLPAGQTRVHTSPIQRSSPTTGREQWRSPGQSTLCQGCPGAEKTSWLPSQRQYQQEDPQAGQHHRVSLGVWHQQWALPHGYERGKGSKQQDREWWKRCCLWNRRESHHHGGDRNPSDAQSEPGTLFVYFREVETHQPYTMFQAECEAGSDNEDQDVWQHRTRCVCGQIAIRYISIPWTPDKGSRKFKKIQEGPRRLKKVQDSPRRLKKAQEGLRRLKKF